MVDGWSMVVMGLKVQVIHRFKYLMFDQCLEIKVFDGIVELMHDQGLMMYWMFDGRVNV